jgi:hypothetical protein
MKKLSVYEKAYFFVVKVYIKQGGQLIEFLKWEQLRWEVRQKYDWYFKYRAALAQVNHPKCYVEVCWGVQDPDVKTAEQLLANKIVAKQRTLTKYKNLLKKSEETWSSMFPIQEDPIYQKAAAKVDRLYTELLELKN